MLDLNFLDWLGLYYCYWPISRDFNVDFPWISVHNFGNILLHFIFLRVNNHILGNNHFFTRNRYLFFFHILKNWLVYVCYAMAVIVAVVKMLWCIPPLKHGSFIKGFCGLLFFFYLFKFFLRKNFHKHWSLGCLCFHKSLRFFFLRILEGVLLLDWSVEICSLTHLKLRLSVECLFETYNFCGAWQPAPIRLVLRFGRSDLVLALALHRFGCREWHFLALSLKSAVLTLSILHHTNIPKRL